MILVINVNIHVQTFAKLVNLEVVLNVFFGYDLNADFNCVPMCGDGNVIPYSAEQCDLTDDGKQDNCQDCLYILIADCKHQLLSMCLECEVGFQLLENACFPHCGDKFILQQYEECDDGNLQPYDGCFQCKFECSEDCNICDKGQCILQCEDGYKFVNNNCLSVCGDQIVTKEEDCDDGNTIQFDGCFNCMYSYSCPENCYDCYQGTCLDCNHKYQLLNSNQCKLQLDCGDGQLFRNKRNVMMEIMRLQMDLGMRHDDKRFSQLMFIFQTSKISNYVSQYDLKQLIYKHLVQLISKSIHNFAFIRKNKFQFIKFKKEELDQQFNYQLGCGIICQFWRICHQNKRAIIT
ncbi:unnamed protein product [Paramecium octaurelia]|uniref:Uncharacterized protein n=1 Tax=Paramecium octaurelia TaxID=43137 RepID=A0A8S1VNG2_PAROT|nr:unnamed protein product [Paramecium octaurelia]